MLRILFKKQMLELNQNFFQNKKKGTSRSKVSAIAFIALYIVLMIFLGGIFFALGINLCEPLVKGGLGWLYFIIMGLIAVALGVFGSVFNTFASLYQAKDNDLLLSMPIPVSAVLAVRLSGVYVMGLVFGSIVMVPTILVYAIVVKPGIGVIIAGIVWLLLISVFVLTLSCILGWVVAKINSKLKNKSMITVIVSLTFFGGYYYVYFKANDLLQMLIANSMKVGMKIKGSAYPLYWLGRAGEGDITSIFLLAAMVILSFALVYFVLSRSFLKIVTSNHGGTKTVYREKQVKGKSQTGALLTKEIQHFLSSATYMLNCALGTLFLVVAAIMLLVKGDWITNMLSQIFAANMDVIAVIGCFAICLIIAMNDITAPSISLEGKNLWIAQSLPVTSWQILKSKMELHLLFTLIPTLLCSVCLVVVLHTSIVLSVFIFLIPLLFTVLSAQFGLAINLKMPNLNWSNEAVAVKQSIGVLLAMLIGWCYSAVMIAIYLFWGGQLGARLYLLFSLILTVALIVGLHYWLRAKGTKILESL